MENSKLRRIADSMVFLFLTLRAQLHDEMRWEPEKQFMSAHASMHAALAFLRTAGKLLD